MKSLKLALRFAIVGALVLALLIPLSMIGGKIAERAAFREQAVQRIARSTAGAQRLVGPLRAVPYLDLRQEAWVDDTGVSRTREVREEGVLLQTPLALEVHGRLTPELRKVGLFEVPTYKWDARLAARFGTALPAVPAGNTRRYGVPYLVLGLSDVRGLLGVPQLQVDGQPLRFQPGTRAFNGRLAGVSASLPAIAGEVIPGRRVQLSFTLAGTQGLEVVPVADDTRVQIASAWPHPSFTGDFLPVQRSVRADGFDAQWAVSSLASQAQTQLQQLKAADTRLDALRVELIDPVDVYTLADRASKYGILFVVLTFVGFGLFELIRRLPIHPLQYLLVGLALAMFFLLLLSLSEHVAFWIAYVVSALACIGVQLVYLSGVLRSWARAAGFAAGLSALYGALYGLLVSEDNALLMGALLLFGVLALIMWVTRRVDWYALSAELR
ncbi:cell envelope integrity protein CreD [Pseudoxanthomonas spadix]|jgi:inner membrane protein|uniref:cell envelope integrity protein CreD n=1 Tax=Pseudoxanthomonas spadix TaxID=415229 RepID=UPI000F010534|nr:cell envelope integrity protein CreD [Pseudoxanthomonas spadix]MBP3973817.1 cell envelope integrity protein CreD [Pseudoxanthomonas spadix]RMW95842.1 cell envelope integrity protein CreD [Pseudoxanthomonas spadix]